MQIKYINMKPKQLVGKSKKWNVIESNAYGFIEALNMVDGTYRSFNVYRRLEPEKNGYKGVFYRSCYKLPTAMKHLNSLTT